MLHNLNERTYGVFGFQKLLESQPSDLANTVLHSQAPNPDEEVKQEVPKTTEVVKAKQLIDQYFKVQQSKKNDGADDKTVEERQKINNSAMKLVL